MSEASSRTSQARADDVSLRDFVVTVLDERNHRYEQRFQILTDLLEKCARITDVEAAAAALKEATLKSEQSVNERLAGVNEFRLTLSDQQKNLITNSEANIRFGSLEKQIDALVAQLTLQEGRRGGVSAVWAALAVAGSLILTVIGIVLSVWLKR